MAVNNEYPVLDGMAPSFADISVKAKPNGAPLIEMVDIAAINTSSTPRSASSAAPPAGAMLRRTTGSKTDEAS